jgi:hypothetical protein
VKGIGTTAGNGRTLHFDIENRPLSYWVPDRPTAEITAIASCWADDPESLDVLLLTVPCRHHGWDCPDMDQSEVSSTVMLEAFAYRYNMADMVSGHYIRKHDLPIINGALMEQNLPLLTEKLTSDTKLDMVKKADIPATQEFLLDTLDIPLKKFHMSQTKWREANRLTAKGLEETYARVASDVLGHIQLRAEMLNRNMLGAPRMWRPGGGDEAQASLH